MGKTWLTPEMALRIEKAFRPDMDHNRFTFSGCSLLMTWQKHVSKQVASQGNGMPRLRSEFQAPGAAPPVPRLPKIQLPKLPFDRISLCFLFRDPLIGAGLEKIERQCSPVEHFVVESANIELRA